ncbi:DUF2089 domain-containing protein [bacterium]|nr:DUF2089 domain-containing protein [bacterium]
MTQSWYTLSKLVQDEEIIVERIRVKQTGIAVEGEFELPPLSQLTEEDQMFVAAFIRCHGSIKEMETLFGVSYPTIKNRLNRIGRLLNFVEINPPVIREDVLEKLEKGEINVDEAEKMLRGRT